VAHAVKNLVQAAAIVAALALPSIAVAQGTTGPILCTTVKAGETANVTLQGVPLSCQPLNAVEIRGAMNTVEKVMHSLHPSDDQEAQMHAAMTQFSQALKMPVIPGNNGGIEE
jgi:hypothetical protein